jgi:hypothetical protein
MGAVCPGHPFSPHSLGISLLSPRFPGNIFRERFVADIPHHGRKITRILIQGESLI